jgi:hypothetical protein
MVAPDDRNHFSWILQTGISCILMAVLVGCTSVARPDCKDQVMVPIQEMGVHVSPAGGSVAELDEAREVIFTVARGFLEKTGSITFVNHHLGQIEARQGETVYKIKIEELSTSRRGLFVEANIRGEDGRYIDVLESRRIAIAIVSSLK